MRTLRRFPLSFPATLREASAALLFFGVLAGQPELHEAGKDALEELAALGYSVSSEAEPVRVFPALTGGDLSGGHAGGWRPGSIFLRENPQGAWGAKVYLRHELMHEASFRTCGGKLPLWAEEAAAMSFSGELPDPAQAAPPDTGELERLRATVRDGAPLRGDNASVLARLIVRDGWPREACAISSVLEKLLGTPMGQAGSGAYILVSLLTGRVLEAGGDQKARHPPGSLLKIPYAAALREATPEVLGEELAVSDTAKLLRRKSAFDLERYRLFLDSAKGAALGQPVDAGELARKDERFWRRYLGERDADGAFPLEASLPELSLILRAALLARPEYFAGLSRNGELANSTLYGQLEADKSALRKLRALAKTGSVSDARFTPLVGHLAVAWPAEKPVYLAVFRQGGRNGASVLPHAAPLLRAWAQRYPAAFGRVRVRLLTLAPRSSWEIRDDCPAFEAGGLVRVSLCGRFRVVASVRGGRSERLVAGIIHETPDSGPVVLETDGETYADAVLDAEAQHLRGAAREALRAVIVWNGSHGSHRHGETDALCDTTHCMVFQGSLPDAKPSRSAPTDAGLLALLDNLATARNLHWLPFAKGGAEPWEKSVEARQLSGRVGETQILDIRRERRKDGAVLIHLLYPGNEDVMSCEVFRNTLKLLSCPDTIRFLAEQGAWVFRGIGEGHGQGLSVRRAEELAEAGRDAAAILRDAYQGRNP
jgi:hypothetical protein